MTKITAVRPDDSLPLRQARTNLADADGEDSARLGWCAMHLGNLLAHDGDKDGALDAYRRVIASGDTEHLPVAALRLGRLLQAAHDTDGALHTFRQGAASGHAEHAPAAAYALGLLQGHRRHDRRPNRLSAGRRLHRRLARTPRTRRAQHAHVTIAHTRG